jgi:hypothetical protein
MRASPKPSVTHSRLIAIFAAPLVCLTGPVLAAPATPASETSAAAPPVWKFVASASLRWTHDSNVHLQDLTPDAGIAQAVLPGRESFITSAGGSFALEHRPGPAFAWHASYVPEFVVYHSAASENHRVHRTALNAQGKAGATAWSFQNSATWIDGNEECPTFGCVGGITAMGGIPLRERREGFVGRHSLRLQHPLGDGWVRPVVTAYVHDFLTRQSRASGYENYLDRQEWTVGADFGRRRGGQATYVAGWRLGRQDQLRLHGIDSPYDSRLLRFLVGLEGAPAPWLTCQVLAGPETRRFVRATPAGFDRTKVYAWIDASASLRAGPRDHLTLQVRRFALPAFASQSMYEDITYDVNWRHRLRDRLLLQAGFKVYGGAWRAPAARRDWIHTPGLQLQYEVNRRSRIECSALADRAFSRLPGTQGRDYRRQLLSVAFTHAR